MKIKFVDVVVAFLTATTCYMATNSTGQGCGRNMQITIPLFGQSAAMSKASPSARIPKRTPIPQPVDEDTAETVARRLR